MESSLSWRLPFILLTVYAEAFALAALLLLPSSPRWLAERGSDQAEITAAWEKLEVRPADQEIAVDRLRTGDADVKYKVTDDPVLIMLSILEIDIKTSGRQMLTAGCRSCAKSWLQVHEGASYSPSFSWACNSFVELTACTMWVMRSTHASRLLLTDSQYAPLLFSQAGVAKAGDTFLVSGVSAIVIVAVSFPGLLWADSWGRRFNTIFGGLGMAITMTITGALYAADAVHTYGPARWVVVICIYLFAVFYCISWAIILKIYAAEIQPQRTRATATSIAHGANWVTNFTVALITPTLIANTGCGAYFLFGSCTFFTVIICWLYMPETRGRTLDELQDGFSNNTVSQLRHTVKGFWESVRPTKGQDVGSEKH